MTVSYPVTTCERCGVAAPTKKVTLFQNVGLVVLRFSRTVSGSLCRNCIETNFWSMSLVSFFFGWWGVISFFFTLVTLPLNVVTYLGSLSLPRPTGGQLAAGGGPIVAGGQAVAPAGTGAFVRIARVASLVLGVLMGGLGGLFSLVGVGMMASPLKPSDVDGGRVMLLMGTIGLVLPGLLLVALGVLGFVLGRRKGPTVGAGRAAGWGAAGLASSAASGCQGSGAGELV